MTLQSHLCFDLCPSDFASYPSLLELFHWCPGTKLIGDLSPLDAKVQTFRHTPNHIPILVSHSATRQAVYNMLNYRWLTSVSHSAYSLCLPTFSIIMIVIHSIVMYHTNPSVCKIADILRITNFHDWYKHCRVIPRYGAYCTITILENMSRKIRQQGTSFMLWNLRLDAEVHQCITLFQ